MDLVNIIKKVNNIFASEENAFDKIPLDFDFLKNSYAIEVYIGSSITDRLELNEIPLQVRVVGLIENKKAILNKCNEIDALLNNKYFDNCWIVRSNPYYNNYTDEDKLNAILIYYINSAKI